MYISEQLLNPDERRLRLSAQLGVGSVVLDNRGTDLVSAVGGISPWDAGKLAAYRPGTELTFKLRPGVKWHDGMPFTSDDVVFNWEYAKTPETASVSIGSYKDITVEKIDGEAGAKIEFTDVLMVGDKIGDVTAYPLSSVSSGRRGVLGHTASIVTAVAYSAAGSAGPVLVTADRDEKVRVSGWPHAFLIRSFCLGHTRFVTGLAVVGTALAAPYLSLSSVAVAAGQRVSVLVDWTQLPPFAPAANAPAGQGVFLRVRARTAVYGVPNPSTYINPMDDHTRNITSLDPLCLVVVRFGGASDVMPAYLAQGPGVPPAPASAMAPADENLLDARPAIAASPPAATHELYLELGASLDVSSGVARGAINGYHYSLAADDSGGLVPLLWRYQIFGAVANDAEAADTADWDHDGLQNLLEYALNGNPSISDSSILPDLVVTATDFEFTYSRLDLSLADTVQSFEYGTNLTGWTPILIPAGPGVSTVGIATVTVTDAGGTDTVKVSIPKAAAVSGKLFGRLQVVK